MADAQAGHRRRVYLAGPDGFTAAGMAWHQQVLKPAIVAAGWHALSPWDGFGDDFAALAARAPGPGREEAYRALNARVGAANAALIEGAEAVLAVLDGTDVDSGTAAEIGYASARGKRVIGLRTDLRTAGDNEGSVVNLQVEHFIRASGGVITATVEEAIGAIAQLP